MSPHEAKSIEICLRLLEIQNLEEFDQKATQLSQCVEKLCTRLDKLQLRVGAVIKDNEFSLAVRKTGGKWGIYIRELVPDELPQPQGVPGTSTSIAPLTRLLQGAGWEDIRTVAIARKAIASKQIPALLESLVKAHQQLAKDVDESLIRLSECPAGQLPEVASSECSETVAPSGRELARDSWMKSAFARKKFKNPINRREAWSLLYEQATEGKYDVKWLCKKLTELAERGTLFSRKNYDAFLGSVKRRLKKFERLPREGQS